MVKNGISDNCKIMIIIEFLPAKVVSEGQKKIEARS